MAKRKTTIKKNEKQQQPERVWRWLVNFWMVIIMFAIVVDFFLRGKYEHIMMPIGMIYVSLLSVYVSTKEFERWFGMYKGRHPGEIGVVLWTLLMMGLIIAKITLGDHYEISPDTVWTYITVITVFIASKTSKLFFTKQTVKAK